MHFISSRNIWLRTTFIALALLAPTVTYVVVARTPVSGGQQSSSALMSSARDLGTSVTLVTTGQHRWACVLMQDAEQLPADRPRPVPGSFSAPLATVATRREH